MLGMTTTQDPGTTGVKDIADALSRLFDGDLRKELGAKGHELAKHLTWEQTTEDTLDAYYRIMELKKSNQDNIISVCDKELYPGVFQLPLHKEPVMPRSRRILRS
jgi:hypothetical protein